MRKVNKIRKAGVMIVVMAMMMTVILPASISSAAFTGSVDVTIDTSAERAAISPLIYGGNWEFNNAKLTSKRLGGNRQTGYNWENNYSNAGSDYQQSSDTYLLTNGNIPQAQWNVPGVVTTSFQDQNLRLGENYSLVTLQAAGYVAADANGTVSETEVAPSARWKEVKFQKGAPFSLTPDTTDNYVYMDEYVNYLVNKYGKANTPTGIKAYSLDNEPALWPSTHARIHPAKPTCAEIVDKNINLAKAVKNVDPYAETYGLVAYGFQEYNIFQDATDWASIKAANTNYSWFLDYYLDSMKKASDAEGKRLVDALDLHWYPEAKGGGTRICFGEDPTNIECNKARLQAPRTLWDPTYTEDSWIVQYNKWALPLIPKVQDSINKFNPGTKLSFTEYSYGADNNITGGIAQADVLGIFGKYGVYNANVWGGGAYTAAGFNIYTNYDGNGSAYGNTKVKAETSDVENSSVYASILGTDDSKLHIIMINKNYDSPMTVNFNIAGGKSYNSGRVWSFDRSSSNITEKDSIQNISGNKFSYTVPALTVCHIVLDASGTPIIYGDVDDSGAVDALDYAAFKIFLMNQQHGYDARYDVNLDKTIDALDLSIIKRYLLRLIKSLPYVQQTENLPPVASFTVTPKTAFTGDAITFDASASKDPDGKINVYTWDFGDGTEGSGVTAIHKYKAIGTFTPKLTVTDDKGITNSITDTVTIASATGDNSDISFEDGTLNGFGTNDSTTTTLSVTTAKAFKGTSSLKWDAVGTANGKLDTEINYSTAVIKPGTTVTFRIWIPSGAPILSVQPFIMPHDSAWTKFEWNSAWKSYDSLNKDDWNEFTVTLPTTTDTTLTQQQMGIQVQTSGAGNFTMYVDSIDW